VSGHPSVEEVALATVSRPRGGRAVTTPSTVEEVALATVSRPRDAIASVHTVAMAEVAP
jgi:hypothetical protein